MKQYFKHLVRSVRIIIILFVIGICILLGAVIIQNSFARQTETEQLAAIDKLFSRSRNFIPISATDENLLLEYVGDFHRSEIYRYAKGCYKWSFRGVGSCSSTIYERPRGVDETGRDSVVWVDIWQITSENPKNLNNMVGIYPCGAELGGEIFLHSVVSNRYGYRACSASLTGRPYLNAILWENSDWLIAVEGQYEAFSLFIAEYPY